MIYLLDTYYILSIIVGIQRIILILLQNSFYPIVIIQ